MLDKIRAARQGTNCLEDYQANLGRGFDASCVRVSCGSITINWSSG